ncbi:MAG: hypothetical protein E6K96_04600 [Thaumarchaeota archaeon]|nr:MAG: hypothetical protein E6K96_04600 [Nitrososphaerota archaeon]
MQDVGEFLHRAKSGRLIFRLSVQVVAGSILLDSKGRRLGRVVEMIGPSSHPYASAAPTSSRVSGKKGDRVFLDN